jgi:hypothetical protein
MDISSGNTKSREILFDAGQAPIIGVRSPADEQGIAVLAMQQDELVRAPRE